MNSINDIKVEFGRKMEDVKPLLHLQHTLMRMLVLRNTTQLCFLECLGDAAGTVKVADNIIK